MIADIFKQAKVKTASSVIAAFLNGDRVIPKQKERAPETVLEKVTLIEPTDQLIK